MDKPKLWHAALVSAIVLAVTTPAFAQSSGSPGGDSGGQTKAGATATTGTTSGTASPAQGAMGATGKTNTTKSGSTMGATGAASGAASADTTRGAPDNTNSKVRTNADMNTWVKGQAGENKGRISRQAYMDEMARRWDSMERNNQGLTPAEVSRLSGKVDIDQSGMPRRGSDVQAGNMGPSSVKGK